MMRRQQGRKEALEKKKLVLETQILEFKKTLEQRKLEEEIEDLQGKAFREKRTARIAIAAAALSAITALAVAGATAFISWQIQEITDQQKQSDAYTSLLKDLGSVNVSARAGAVIGLTKFARTDADRSKQTTTILVTQLTAENDSRVLAVLIPAVVSLGPAALSDVARANRDMYQKFRAAFFSFLVSKLNINERETPPRELLNNALGNASDEVSQQLISYILTSLDTDLLTQSEKAALEKKFGASDFQLGGELVARAEWLSCQHLRLKALKDALRQRPLSSDNTHNKTTPIKEIRDYARGLYVTSITLGRLIPVSGTRSEKDLNSIAIYFADFEHAMLAGADLRGAYIAGSLGYANLTGADLSGANLRRANIDNAILSYTTLEDTFLPPLAPESLKSLNLTGADWWDAAAVRINEPTASDRLLPIAMQVIIKLNGHLATVTEKSSCPSNEVPQIQANAGEQIAGDDSSGTTVSLCSENQDLVDIRTPLGRTFPRKENQRKRTEWLRQNAIDRTSGEFGNSVNLSAFDGD